VELIVNDEKGNINSILFSVKAKQLSGYKSNSNKYNAFCNKDFKLKEDNFDISIQRGSIVNDMYIHKRTYIKAPIEGGVELGNKDDKVIRAFKIGLKINNPIKQKESKLVMTINGDVIGGQFEDGWLRAESKAFGTFNYNYDTIAPTINILHSNKKKITIIHFISFKISDKLSGIADYNVYVNDVWQIAEYDVKTQTVTCFLTEPPKTYNSIRIEVIDKVGNKAIVSL
jgi:hypothetical protein